MSEEKDEKERARSRKPKFNTNDASYNIPIEHQTAHPMRSPEFIFEKEEKDTDKDTE
ncbi:MAG: hypothetical protein HWN66_06210 [Candidatus Helarchaeota archaeon]|nr:hypothetical protein [Candidatus Helarchaeota archaeon]